MKPVHMLLVLTICSAILSCKKDESSSSTSSTNLLQDTTGMKVIYINIPVQSSYEIPFDIDGDAQNDLSLFLYQSQNDISTGSRIYITNINSNLFFRVRQATPAFIHWKDQTIEQYDPTTQTHFKRSVLRQLVCSKISEEDRSYNFGSEQLIWLAEANEKLLDTYLFKNWPGVSTTMWQNTVTYHVTDVKNDTLFVYDETVQNCQNMLPHGADRYLLFKLQAGNTHRLGWLRIKLINDSTLQVMEAAVQQ